MTIAYMSTLDTPTGPFTTLVTDDGAVLASGWTAAPDQLLLVIAAPLRPTDIRTRSDLGPVTAAARAYHDGDLSAIHEIEVRQFSGEFIQRAWSLLRTVPPGKPLSYSDFATLAGRPAAIRAAASACARNAAALYIPCHRILRSDGTLGGYRWGVDVKRWLLAHESSAGGASLRARITLF